MPRPLVLLCAPSGAHTQKVCIPSSPCPHTPAASPARLRRRGCLRHAARHRRLPSRRPRGRPATLFVGSRPAYATRTADTGPVPAGSHVSAHLYLNSRDPQGLAAFLRDVSDPRSPSLPRHYLTPAEYQRHFGPTDRQSGLSRHGWAGPDSPSPAEPPTIWGSKGPPGAVRQAFGTSLHSYGAGHGTSDAAGDLSVPASSAPPCSACPALSTPAAAHPCCRPPHRLSTYPPTTPSAPVTSGRSPPQAYPRRTGETATYAPCPYTPAQLRHAYGTGAEVTGRGSTIAVVDTYGSPDMLTDADRYARATGDHAFRPGQYRPGTSLPATGTSTTRARPRVPGPANRLSTSTSPTASPRTRTSSTSVRTPASTTT